MVITLGRSGAVLAGVVRFTERDTYPIVQTWITAAT